MLGDGRPFALELVDPHRTSCSREEALQLQQLINSRTQDIAVNRLQLVPKEPLAGLKGGEEHKTKSYSALCVLLDGAGPLTEEQRASLNLRELVIMQKTPLRVLHRSIQTPHTFVHFLAKFHCAKPVNTNSTCTEKLAL